MIELSNGHKFEFMAASGAFNFGDKLWFWDYPFKWAGLLDPALFTVVTKTLTFERNEGNLRWYNPLGSVRFLKGGVLNAVGLTNPGIKWWCQTIGPKISSSKIPVVVSIASDKIEEIEDMAEMLNCYDLVGVEIDDSCVNVSRCDTSPEGTLRKCEALYGKTDFPIILKFSVAHKIEEIVPHLEGIVQAISINSVPWSLVFPDSSSPFAHLGGGAVSGKIAQPFTWTLAQNLINMTKIPVIGPSVWEYSDIEKLINMGTKAESFGSIFLRYTWRPTMYVRKFTKNKKIK